jgi:hypothetical protein
MTRKCGKLDKRRPSRPYYTHVADR